MEWIAKTVLTRVNTVTGVAYRDDPTIMAWELMNEPRCPSDLSGRTIQSWIAEMASHVKSIDGRHLLEAGLEGFYGAADARNNPSGNQVGTDFVANNQAPGIDFATVHAYPDQWLPAGTDAASQLRFLGGWLDAHIADAREKLRKPLLVAEFGESRRDGGGEQRRDAVFGEVYGKVYESARGGGPAAGALFWQLMAEGMDSYGDGYEVVLGRAPATDGVIVTQSRRLQGLARAFARARRARNGKAGKGAKGGN